MYRRYGKLVRILQIRCISTKLTNGNAVSAALGDGHRSLISRRKSANYFHRETNDWRVPVRPSFRRWPRSPSCMYPREKRSRFCLGIVYWLTTDLASDCQYVVCHVCDSLAFVPHSRPRSATRRSSSDPFEITCLRTSTLRPRRGNHTTAHFLRQEP